MGTPRCALLHFCTFSHIASLSSLVKSFLLSTLSVFVPLSCFHFPIFLFFLSSILSLFLHYTTHKKQLFQWFLRNSKQNTALPLPNFKITKTYFANVSSIISCSITIKAPASDCQVYVPCLSLLTSFMDSTLDALLDFVKFKIKY